MGVTPDLQEGALETGDVVFVRRGKNKGKFSMFIDNTDKSVDETAKMIELFLVK